MGAMSFFETGRGVNYRDVFNEVCAEARHMYGDDPYSGTIATTELAGRPQHFADNFSSKVENQAYDYVSSVDFGRKWESRCLDLGVCEYHVTTVKKPRIQKESPKYETRFVVFGNATKPIETAETKEKAEEVARRHALEYGVDTVIKKQKLLVSGTEEVSRFECDTKVYKSKPKRIPKGAHVEEIHMYAFYGWASC